MSAAMGFFLLGTQERVRNRRDKPVFEPLKLNAVKQEFNSSVSEISSGWKSGYKKPCMTEKNSGFGSGIQILTAALEYQLFILQMYIMTTPS